MSRKNPVKPPGIDPGTVRLVAPRLNQYATPGPYIVGYTFKYKRSGLLNINEAKYTKRVLISNFFFQSGLGRCYKSFPFIEMCVIIMNVGKISYDKFI